MKIRIAFTAAEMPKALSEARKIVNRYPDAEVKTEKDTTKDFRHIYVTIPIKK